MMKESDKSMDNNRNNYTENRKNIEIDKNIHHFNPKSYPIPNHSEDRVDFAQRKEQQYESIKSKKDEDIGDFTKNYDYISNKYDEYMILLDELNYKKYSIEYYIDIQSKIQNSIDKIVKELEELKIQKNISSKQTHIKQLNQMKLDYLELYRRFETILYFKKLTLFENKFDKIVENQDKKFDILISTISGIDNKFNLSRINFSDNLNALKNKYMKYIASFQEQHKDTLSETCRNTLKEFQEIVKSQSLLYDDVKRLVELIEESKNCDNQEEMKQKIIDFIYERSKLEISQVKKSEKNLAYNILDAFRDICKYCKVRLKKRDYKYTRIDKKCKKAKSVFWLTFIIAFFGALISYVLGAICDSKCFTNNDKLINDINITTSKIQKITTDINKSTNIINIYSKNYILDSNTTVYFQNGQSNMDDDNITKLLNFIKEHKNPKKINLIGYVTSTGLHKPDKYASNKELAQARAQNIKVFLVEHNITINENIDISYKVEENDTNPNNQKVKVLFYKSLLRK